VLTGGIDISDISSLGGAAHLSSDLFDEPGRSTPPVPPGLEGLGQSLQPLDLDDEDDVPRRSTPSIPPGFTAPVIAPLREDAAASLPTSRSSSRASLRRGTSQILPAVPVLSGTPSRAPTPLRHETRPFANLIDDFDTPTKRGRSESHLANVEYAENNDTAPGAEVETPSKAEIKAEKAEAKKAKRADKMAKKEAERLEKAEKAEKAAAAALAAAEATVKKNAADKLEKAAAAASQAKIQEAQPAPPGATKEEKTQAAINTVDLVKDLTPAEAAAAARAAAGETVSKKKHPGKIDITAAVLKGGEVPTSLASTPVKTENIPRTWNTITTSRPQSPSIASDSARKVTAPRTLRLTTALPPPAPIVAPAIRTLPATASRMPSRQPSIASIYMPGTPGGDSISDDVSITSTSLSRASTPPPPSSSRVGSAFVRQNTKSQQKKLRQEKARQMTEEILTKDAQIVEEPIQEAITSRKKKSKSAKPSTPAPATPAAVTPVSSRPASPKMKAKPEEPPKVEKPATPVKVETPPPPPPAPVTPVKAPTPPPPAALTPASLIAELRSEHGSLAGAFDAFFRPFAQSVAHYKPTQQPTLADLTAENAIPPHQPELQKEDIDVLLSGSAWRPMTDEQQRLWERLVISPSGTIIRHMEPQLEERFLAMEAMNRQLPENLKFHPIQHSNTPTDLDFPAVDINVLRREFEGASTGNRHRSANAMEKAVEEGSKKGSFLVDTAGKYVNEFIMPPVPLSPPNEKAIKEEQQRDKNQIVSVEDLERRLTEARRFADDKEAGLRRLVKRNRKVIGLTH
jgi:CCR4-NOT transcription complex subunit 4